MQIRSVGRQWQRFRETMFISYLILHKPMRELVTVTRQLHTPNPICARFRHLQWEVITDFLFVYVLCV